MTKTPLKKQPQKNLQKKSDTKLKQSFGEHLVELRNRLAVCVSSLVIAMMVVYHFHDQLLAILIKPLHSTLFYNAPIGALSFTLNVTLYAGLFLASPVILYELFLFLLPAFPQIKKFSIIMFIIIFMFLFVMGVFFGYYVSLPITLHFFNQFSSPTLKSLITTEEYMSFLTEYLFAFGLVFEIPVLLFLINTIHRLDYKWLLKQQRYVIVLSFLAGAILTPDPLNQIILAGPIVVLYEASIVMIWIINRKKVKKTQND